jgi:hypothetical protein
VRLQRLVSRPLPGRKLRSLSAKVFLYIETERVELGTIESGRDKGANASRAGRSSLLRMSGELANAQQRQSDTGQD